MRQKKNNPLSRIRLPRPRKLRSFDEKFGQETVFFGSEAQAAPQQYGSLPLLVGGVLSALLLVLAVLLLARLWKVDDVTAADGTYYTAAVLRQYSGIEAGDEMVGFDTSDVERRLKENLPLLSSVKVRKHLSGAVSIKVTEEKALYYTRHNVNYYIIAADDMEVLCVMSSPTEARRVGATYLGLPECARLRVGETLGFVNLPYVSDSAAGETSGAPDYEVETDEPKEENAYVPAFVEALMSSPMADRVVGMDVSDRYDISFVLQGKIRVRVGDMEELARKLEMAERSIADSGAGNAPEGLSTLVDVSDPSRIVHRTSPALELPEWAS